MYKKNDYIVYGKTGVCKVTDIIEPKDKYFKQGKLYYVLEPVSEKCTIFAPVDSKMFMRPIITAEAAENLIRLIPEIEAEAYYSSRVQELVQHYESMMEDHKCSDLLELTMSIYAKKKDVEQQNKKVGKIDEKYMKQAEELLFAEFSVALGIEKDDVSDYIENRLKKIGKGKAE